MYTQTFGEISDLETGYLFKLAHLGTYPSPNDIWWWPLKLEAHTVSRWAVRILLECFLVTLCTRGSLVPISDMVGLRRPEQNVFEIIFAIRILHTNIHILFRFII